MSAFKIRTTLIIEHETVVEDVNVQAAMELARSEAKIGGEIIDCSQEVSLAEEKEVAA